MQVVFLIKRKYTLHIHYYFLVILSRFFQHLAQASASSFASFQSTTIPNLARMLYLIFLLSKVFEIDFGSASVNSTTCIIIIMQLMIKKTELCRFYSGLNLPEKLILVGHEKPHGSRSITANRRYVIGMHCAASFQHFLKESNIFSF